MHKVTKADWSRAAKVCEDIGGGSSHGEGCGGCNPIAAALTDRTEEDAQTVERYAINIGEIAFTIAREIRERPHECGEE